MRDTLRLSILAALFFTVAGCSSYDRELLGDPEPAAPAEPAYEESELAPPTDDSLGVGMFNELRYYGQWYWVEPYGWTWRPTVISDWQPFINGHWIWSQYGWMWVSYEPWGWATSHYGYWVNDFSLGWVWIPDYTWSPAQVDWLMYDGYIGWAPVPPPGVRFKDPWQDSYTPWVTVPVRRFKETDVGNYRARSVPKFKDGAEPEISRAAPDVREIERQGARFSKVEVQLDRRVVGEREFAKIRYPERQRAIIESHRTSVKSNRTSAQFAPPPPAPTTNNSHDGGATVGPPPPSTGSKSKGSKSGSSGTKTERKIKDRGGSKDDKKDDGKSKSGKKG